MALMLICTPVWVAAHGSGQHVLGVVTAIDTVHIEIKTPKVSRFLYGSRTKPTTRPRTCAELKIRLRWVIGWSLKRKKMTPD